MQQRTLKCKLTSRDQIHFLHVPKTGGTTFMTILENIVGAENYKSADKLRYLENSPYFLAKFRIIRGHFGYTIFQHAVRRPIFITMLRNPVDRIVSHMLHLQRNSKIPATMSFQEFVEQDIRYTNNTQVNMLAGIQRKNQEKLDPELLLEVAKARLDQIAFFGILERFNEAIDLLTYTFDWQPVTDYAVLNQSPQAAKRTIDAATIALIEHYNQTEIEFYRYACQVFETRLAQMRAEMNA